MVLNDLSSWWSKFKFGTHNKNLDGDCRCKSTSNCNSCCNDMFLFCLCSKVGFQTCQLVSDWPKADRQRHQISIILKTCLSPFIVGTIYGTFSMNETNEERFHALQQSLLICPAVSLIGAGSFIFARFILTK